MCASLASDYGAIRILHHSSREGACIGVWLHSPVRAQRIPGDGGLAEFRETSAVFSTACEIYKLRAYAQNVS